MKLPRLLVTSFVAVAVIPASAVADVAPPGNSAVDQYRESAPSTPTGSKKLSPERRRELDSKGKDGSALAAALDRNGGVPTDGTGSSPSTSESPGAPPSTPVTPDPSKESQGRKSDSATTTAAPTSSGGEGRSSSGGSVGGGSSSPAPAKSRVATKTSTTTAAASATVGPLPVWSLMVGALLIVGVGFVLRRRAV